MGLRQLATQEINAVAGSGNSTPNPDVGAWVQFYDDNGNGILDAGDRVVGYTVDGNHMTADQYELYNQWQGTVRDGAGVFENLGTGLSNVLSDPWRTGGYMLDNLDELFKSVDLTGSEGIDWKTGGYHHQGDNTNQ